MSTAAAPDRSAEALGPPLPHARDRDAGALGAVPPPPPRVGSFTGPTDTGALSRASSSHSVSSYGSVPRSSSFTRSRKFARGDVLSLDDARHVLDSNHHTYAGSLKFAAAQQILQEHLPSAPERGDPPAVPPSPPTMPHNELLASALRQPGPFPERVPVPLMPIRKPRPPTPPRRKPQPPAHPGAFNIAAPASETRPFTEETPITEPEKEEGKPKPARRAFARILSRSISSKRAVASASSPVEDVEEQQKPSPEAPKKKLRFDDRNPDLHIAVASSATAPGSTSASPKRDTSKQEPSESEEPKASKPRLLRKSKSAATKKTSKSMSPNEDTVEDRAKDILSHRTSLPTGAGRPDVPAPGSADAAPASNGTKRRLQRARTFFTSLRQSNRTTSGDLERTPDRPVADAAADSNEQAPRASVRTNSEDRPEPLSAKPRVRRSSSAAAIVGIRKPFSTSAVKRTDAQPESAPDTPDAIPDATPAPQARKKRTQLPRAASMKVLSFFENRTPAAPTEDDGSLRRTSSAVGVQPTPPQSVSSKKEKNKHADRAEVIVDAEAPAPGAARTDSVFQSPMRRFSRNTSSAPATDGEPREKTGMQKSIARAQAASASLVARARKLPRSVTIHRFGSRDVSGASSARATPSKPSRVSEDANVKHGTETPIASVKEDISITKASNPASQTEVVSDATDNQQLPIANVQNSAQTKRTADDNVKKPVKSHRAEAVEVSATSPVLMDVTPEVPQKTEVKKTKVENPDVYMTLPLSTAENVGTRAIEQPSIAEEEEGNTVKSTISSTIAMWENAVKNSTSTSTTTPVSTKEHSASPITEQRAASEYGATTKNIPEFVTIKKVIRRKKPDGTEEVITKRVRERPTAVRPNGDVVVQRTVRRLKKDGSGEKETVVVEKVIPRRGQSGELKLISQKADEGLAEGSTVGTSISTPVDINVDDRQKSTNNESTLLVQGSNKSRSETAEARNEGKIADRELREEDWPNRYKSLQASANAKSTAEKLVNEEMNQKDKRVEDKSEDVRPGSFGMMQQGLPRGSSFQGQEPYVHDKRKVRMPGAAAYTNVSDMLVESTSMRQQRIDKRNNSGLVRAISRRKGGRMFGSKDKDKQKDTVADNTKETEKKADDVKEDRDAKPLGTAGTGSPALTRVMSFDDKRQRRSKSHLEVNEPVLQTGTSPNNRPGNVPKSSSVGGNPPSSDGKLKTFVSRFKRRFNVPNAAS